MKANISEVCENRRPSKIFGSKVEDVTGEWTKIHSKELGNLFSSLIVFLMAKPRRTRRRECTEFMEAAGHMPVRRTEQETQHRNLGLGVRI